MAVKGLSGYRKSKESTGGQYFKPKADQEVKIRPLMELDFDAKNYSEKNGLALFIDEFQHPDNFRLSFVDTLEDEGACVGHELANQYGWKTPDKDSEPEKFAAWKNWRPKQRMYIAVLVDDGESAERVEILQLGMGPKQAQSKALIKCHENNGSITDRWWLYSRTGSGQYDTTYDLTAMDKDTDLPDVTDYEVPDLTAGLNFIPYAEQRSYLGLDRPVAQPQPEGAPTANSNAPEELEW